MKIVCPNCTTSYDVEAAALGESGRSVRCVRCRTVWFATPGEEPAPVEEPAFEVADADAPAPAESSQGAEDEAPAEDFDWSFSVARGQQSPDAADKAADVADNVADEIADAPVTRRKRRPAAN